MTVKSTCKNCPRGNYYCSICGYWATLDERDAVEQKRLSEAAALAVRDYMGVEEQS